MDRAEVATPTFSAIDLAENPLDRRALVSLEKQLEIDQPTNKLLTVCYLSVFKQRGKRGVEVQFPDINLGFCFDDIQS